MSNFNIPKSFTQGDRQSWIEHFPDSEPGVDTVSCFIRGQSSLDLTGVPNGDLWSFEITEEQSSNLNPGIYKAHFAHFAPGWGRTTLGIATIRVCADLSLESLVDNRTSDEIELELVNTAIATSLAGGVAEYEIGTRKIRYHSIESLYERQRQLKVRIARANRGGSGLGRNVGVRFGCD